MGRLLLISAAIGATLHVGRCAQDYLLSAEVGEYRRFWRTQSLTNSRIPVVLRGHKFEITDEGDVKAVERFSRGVKTFLRLKSVVEAGMERHYLLKPNASWDATVNEVVGVSPKCAVRSPLIRCRGPPRWNIVCEGNGGVRLRKEVTLATAEPTRPDDVPPIFANAFPSRLADGWPKKERSQLSQFVLDGRPTFEGPLGCPLSYTKQESGLNFLAGMIGETAGFVFHTRQMPTDFQIPRGSGSTHTTAKFFSPREVAPSTQYGSGGDALADQHSVLVAPFMTRYAFWGNALAFLLKPYPCGRHGLTCQPFLRPVVPKSSQVRLPDGVFSPFDMKKNPKTGVAFYELPPNLQRWSDVTDAILKRDGDQQLEATTKGVKKTLYAVIQSLFSLLDSGVEMKGLDPHSVFVKVPPGQALVDFVDEIKPSDIRFIGPALALDAGKHFEYFLYKAGETNTPSAFRFTRNKRHRAADFDMVTAFPKIVDVWAKRLSVSHLKPFGEDLQSKISHEVKQHSEAQPFLDDPWLPKLSAAWEICEMVAPKGGCFRSTSGYHSQAFTFSRNVGKIGAQALSNIFFAESGDKNPLIKLFKGERQFSTKG